MQTHLMLQKLSQFVADMTTCLVVGGSRNMRAQEAELRARPDVVVRACLLFLVGICGICMDR